MLMQELFCGRPHFESSALHKPGMSHTLYAPLLCDIRCDADERW